MPRPKRRAPRTKIAYSRQDVVRLATGISITTNDSFGRGPDALDAMRAAWADEELRDRVYEFFEYRRAQGRPLKGFDIRTARYVDRTQPWAATKFDITGEHHEAESSRKADQDAATGSAQRRTRKRASIDRNRSNKITR